MKTAQSEVLGGEERLVILKSGGTTSWTDGTVVEIRWTFHFEGSRAGSYTAAPVAVLVRPSNAQLVTGGAVQVLERILRSGVVAQKREFPLEMKENSLQCAFEWHSTVNVPEQEISVQLRSNDSVEPTMFLRDPISRRTNFVIAFSGMGATRS